MRAIQMKSSMPAVAALISVGAVCVVVACTTEYVARRAPLFAAYSDNADVVSSLLGRRIVLSPGANPIATSAPQTLFFDPNGVARVMSVSGSPFSSNEEQRAVAAGLAAKASDTCSGRLGLTFSTTDSGTMDVQVQRIYTVDPTQRRYTDDLVSCCDHPDPSCGQWVVNAAYYSSLSFNARTSREIGAGANVECTASPATPPSSGGGTSDAGTAADGGAPDAGTETPNTNPTHIGMPEAPGARIGLTVDTSDRTRVRITSEGWNIAEVIPLAQVCAEHRRACETRNAGLRVQYNCR